MSEERKIRVAITHGDINGIGYEVTLKALEDNRLLELCTPILYGSAKIANYYRKSIDLQPIPFVTINNGEEIQDGSYNLINVIGEEIKVEPGNSTKTAGEASVAALQRAIQDLKEGNVDVLVTAPINKNNIQSDEFTFPGHTEFLQEKIGAGEKALMILACERLKVALVTTHVPVGKIAEIITTDEIYEKIEIFNKSLIRDYGIVRPRIAVLGLNPHAGDDGVIGSEESEIIIPAIVKARENRIEAYGPYPADGFFGSANYTKFDGVLAMYHDQGLIPFKTIAMESGVNFTAGLPFVRTSPDHGTAYDIAGKNLADESSMRHAIYTACDIFRNRRNYAEMTRNPLKKQYFDKSKDNVVLDLTSDN